MKVGVLALQGAFVEHEHTLRELGANPVEVRLPEQLHVDLSDKRGVDIVLRGERQCGIN